MQEREHTQTASSEIDKTEKRSNENSEREREVEIATKFRLHRLKNSGQLNVNNSKCNAFEYHQQQWYDCFLYFYFFLLDFKYLLL